MTPTKRPRLRVSRVLREARAARRAAKATPPADRPRTEGNPTA